jgi:lambda family phage portal protein
MADSKARKTSGISKVEARPATIARPRRTISAKYDSAQTTPDNSRHWAAADNLSPVAANSAAVRATLRKRARYEYLNNTYCKSMVRVIADDVIGTTPHLQLEGGQKETNSRIEKAFANWLIVANIPEKLRQMKRSQIVDGESFAIIATNPRIRTDVKTDLLLIEADRVTEPTGTSIYNTNADGITYDSFGNPVSFKVLKTHPGDYMFNSTEYMTVGSDYMLHLFDADRAEQQRGIPSITPALPLFAQLRRYTLAVLAAAETAADFSVFLKTQGMPDEEGYDAIEALEQMEIIKRMMTTLPQGWDISQLKAEQPTTTYSDFKKEILNEIARTLNLPFNVAIGNSAGYNYASGRLDHQTYFKNVRIAQYKLGIEILDRLFEAWYTEAVLLPEYQYMRAADLNHTWIFDGWEHVDPAKEANAQKTRLNSLTTTLAEEYAKKGKDWETQLEQIANERKKIQQLGITVEDVSNKAIPQIDDDKDENEDEDE